MLMMDQLDDWFENAEHVPQENTQPDTDWMEV